MATTKPLPTLQQDISRIFPGGEIGLKYGDTANVQGLHDVEPGVDVLLPVGTPIYALRSGYLSSYSANRNPIIVSSINGKSVYQTYQHLVDVPFTASDVGSFVPQGSFLGRIGQVGGGTETQLAPPFATVPLYSTTTQGIGEVELGFFSSGQSALHSDPTLATVYNPSPFLANVGLGAGTNPPGPNAIQPTVPGDNTQYSTGTVKIPGGYETVVPTPSGAIKPYSNPPSSTGTSGCGPDSWQLGNLPIIGPICIAKGPIEHIGLIIILIIALLLFIAILGKGLIDVSAPKVAV